MRYPLAAALVLACLPALAEQHEDVPSEQSVLPQAPAATHRIPLAVVILKGSRWTYSVVERRVAKAREIFAQCGVRLEPSIIELSTPWGGGDVLYEPGSSGEPKGMGATWRALGQPRPVLFYVDRFADNAGQSGTARPPHTSARADEVDTAWIAYTDRNNDGSGQYQVDAHELLHLLADLNHESYDENPARRARKDDPPLPGEHDQGLLVGNPYIRTNRIAPRHCARIKARSLARPL